MACGTKWNKGKDSIASEEDAKREIVSNADLLDGLNSILIELRIANTYMAMSHNIEIKESDLEN